MNKIKKILLGSVVLILAILALLVLTAVAESVKNEIGKGMKPVKIEKVNLSSELEVNP